MFTLNSASANGRDVLLPHHRKFIEGSGINESVLKARGYYSATHASGLARLGFSSNQQNAPALVIPVRDISGAVSMHQIMPDRPRSGHRRLAKYENPFGAKLKIDIPPTVRDRVRNGMDPLCIVQGIQKADAAVSHGLTCIGLMGAYGWKNQEEFWHSIPLARRMIFILFDSDFNMNASVATAANTLAAYVASMGAIPKLVTLSADGEQKVSHDDFQKSQGTPNTLYALAKEIHATKNASSN
jgi:hypothetical protein